MNKQQPILIHTHFHKRRTGVTRSIENVLPYFSKFETYIYGYNVAGKKISFSSLKKLVCSDKQVSIHCHRNNEILRMLFLRFIGGKFKLIATRHAESKPSKLSLFLYKKADEVITLTNNVSASIGIKNTLIPHGVDTKLFVPNTGVQIPKITQKNIILCAGRVRKAKGQKTLIEASMSVLQQNPDYTLVIVGKVDKTQFLEELQLIISENNLENQVYFFDETSDIISYYQAASIVVVPSFSEGFSLVCAEAMSCGTTTIATKDVGIHSDLIQHAENGYLFEAGNSQELSSILQGIVNNNLPSTGEKARISIEKYWSAEKEAAALSKIYIESL